MIVLCFALADAVRALLQPFDVGAKPLFHSLLVFRAPVFGTRQQADGVHYVREVLAFQDSCRPSIVDTGNPLGKLKIRIHSRCRLKKPGVQQQGGTSGIRLVPGEIKSQCQRARISAQPAHVAMIGELVDFRISLAIVANIRPAGVLGIRPKIWRQAHVVVLVAAGRSDIFLRDRKRTFRHRLVGGIACSDHKRILRTCAGMFLGCQYFRVEQEHARKLTSN